MPNDSIREVRASNASPSPLDAARHSSDETASPLDLPGRWAVDKYLEPGPWELDKNIAWIWAPSLKGGNTHVGTVELRGWGYLTGGGHGALGLSGDEAAKAQDAIGEFVVAAVNAALSAAPASAPSQGADGWLPIETAPKDGTPFLAAFNSGEVEKAWWGLSLGEWAFLISRPWGDRYPDDKATHWMPLPEAPREAAGPEGGPTGHLEAPKPTLPTPPATEGEGT